MVVIPQGKKLDFKTVKPGKIAVARGQDGGWKIDIYLCSNPVATPTGEHQLDVMRLVVIFTVISVERRDEMQLQANETGDKAPEITIQLGEMT